MVTPSWNSFSGPETIKTSNKDNLSQIQDTKDNKENSTNKNWGSFQDPDTYQGKPNPTQDESWLGYMARNIASNASRVVEQVAGRYGNIEKFSKDVLSSNPALGGFLGTAYSELLGKDRWESLVKGSPGQQQLLPTSEDFKKASQTLTKGYTTPKTKGEEKFQNAIEDIGSTLSGRSAPQLNRQSAVNHLLIPAAANVAKETVEGLGFGEDKANLAKIAVWFPAMLANNVNGRVYAANLMNNARNQFSPTLQANIPRFEQRLNNLLNQPNLLISDPRSALARQAINTIQNDISNGQTNIQSLLTMYDGINALKRSRGLFELGRNDRNFARRSIDNVLGAIREEITDVGRNNPQALQNWENGLSAWRTIHQSNAISNFVQNLANGPYKGIITGPAAGLFGALGYSASKAPLFLSGGASAAIPLAYQTGKTIYRMMNNRNLYNYYWNAISAATRNNASSFISNYLKLNKGLESGDKNKTSKRDDKNK